MREFLSFSRKYLPGNNVLPTKHTPNIFFKVGNTNLGNEQRIVLYQKKYIVNLAQISLVELEVGESAKEDK